MHHKLLHRHITLGGILDTGCSFRMSASLKHDQALLRSPLFHQGQEAAMGGGGGVENQQQGVLHPGKDLLINLTSIVEYCDDVRVMLARRTRFGGFDSFRPHP